MARKDDRFSQEVCKAIGRRSDRAVATLAGISNSSVKRWKDGWIPSSRTTILRLSDALGVPRSPLLEKAGFFVTDGDRTHDANLRLLKGGLEERIGKFVEMINEGSESMIYNADMQFLRCRDGDNTLCPPLRKDRVYVYRPSSEIQPGEIHLLTHEPSEAVICGQLLGTQWGKEANKVGLGFDRRVTNTNDLPDDQIIVEGDRLILTDLTVLGHVPYALQPATEA